LHEGASECANDTKATTLYMTPPHQN